MSGGSYLGTPSGSNPAMFNPASRVFQGWVTPTVVNKNLKGYKLRPRTALPTPGYTVAQADRNLLLVPTYEVALGETDKPGHVWGEDDVYGLAKDPATGKYVVEGFYVENVSRHGEVAQAPPAEPHGLDVRPQVPRVRPRWCGTSTTGASPRPTSAGNDAQNDPQRYQMDLEEFDHNDNTQELQLNLSRGNPADYLPAPPPASRPARGAAARLTAARSATRRTRSTSVASPRRSGRARTRSPSIQQPTTCR